ncbi:MAG: DNA repair protein RadA, partial [Bacteroidales bacterium]|nr:DNA repair protein RadA [Bacteroidales bacterium]
MAKSKTVWFCSSCGNESSKWMGRCPACGEWNTMVEEPKAPSAKSSSGDRSRSLLKISDARPTPINESDITQESRISIGNEEIERILGGGLVRGSMILIGGEPGIGKSTLSLQIPLGCPSLRTLYVSGEESPRQIKLRAQRLSGGKEDELSNCLVLGETLLENIISTAKETATELLIIDS